MPSQWRERVDQARRKLTELVAEGDEQLLDRYLTDGELTDGALLAGLRVGAEQGSLVPVVGGSALRRIGVSTLLNSLVEIHALTHQTSPVCAVARFGIGGWLSSDHARAIGV